MIITTYEKVPPNTRVVLSSGRIVHVTGVVDLGATLLVGLRNSVGQARTITVSRGELALWAPFDDTDLAVAVLATRFPTIEYVRSI